MGNVINKFNIKIALQFVILLLALLVLQPQPLNHAQDFPDVCQESENILRNCDFSQGLEHWEPFLESGSADISVLQGGGECHAPLCPAAYIVSADHFIGGLKQQVPVEQGRNYYANIVWLVFDSLVNDASIHNATGGIGRRVGIDPFGGTDPTSPNVVWSEDNWRNDCKICNVEHVTVTAQADTITVFLRIENTWKLRAAEQGFPLPPSNDKFWLDDLGLKPVGGEPVDVQVKEAPPTAEPTVEPTVTPVPPTNTPLPTEEPPLVESRAVAQVETTEEPQQNIETEVEVEPTDELASTEEATTEPTNEPTAEPDSVTPEPTNTPIPPPPTLTPTHTPPPTATSRPRPSPTPQPAGDGSGGLALAAGETEASNLPVMLSTVGTLGCVGGLGLSFAGAIMAGLVWLYRLGWGKSETDDDLEYEEDEYADNDDDSDEDEIPNREV